MPQERMSAAQYRALVRPSGFPAGARPGPARRAPHAVGKMNGTETRYLRKYSNRG